MFYTIYNDVCMNTIIPVLLPFPPLGFDLIKDTLVVADVLVVVGPAVFEMGTSDAGVNGTDDVISSTTQ